MASLQVKSELSIRTKILQEDMLRGIDKFSMSKRGLVILGREEVDQSSLRHTRLLCHLKSTSGNGKKDMTLVAEYRAAECKEKLYEKF